MPAPTPQLTAAAAAGPNDVITDVESELNVGIRIDIQSSTPFALFARTTPPSVTTM